MHGFFFFFFLSSWMRLPGNNEAPPSEHLGSHFVQSNSSEGDYHTNILSSASVRPTYYTLATRNINSKRFNCRSRASAEEMQTAETRTAAQGASAERSRVAAFKFDRKFVILISVREGGAFNDMKTLKSVKVKVLRLAKSVKLLPLSLP